MNQFVRVLPLAELPPGQMVGVNVNGRRILLTNIEGQVYAASGTCTHEEFDLSHGHKVGERIVCALHPSEFDLRTGQVYNPPATEPLETHAVKIEDGYVFVEVD